MARHKAVLKTLAIQTARRRRKCYHSKAHQILKGDLVLLVKEGRVEKGYCRGCALVMLDLAHGTILRLRNDLEGERHSSDP